MNNKKIGFHLVPCPIPSCAKKDQAKADISNKYIGFGKEGTSTLRYKDNAIEQDIPANINEYDSSDIVYVSVNGGENFIQENFDKTLELTIKALENKATIVCDNYNQRNNSYNSIGEGQLYKEIYKVFNDNLIEDTNNLFSKFKLKS